MSLTSTARRLAWQHIHPWRAFVKLCRLRYKYIWQEALQRATNGQRFAAKIQDPEYDMLLESIVEPDFSDRFVFRQFRFFIHPKMLPWQIVRIRSKIQAHRPGLIQEIDHTLVELAKMQKD